MYTYVYCSWEVLTCYGVTIYDCSSVLTCQGDNMTTVVWEMGSGWLTHIQCPACTGGGIAPGLAASRVPILGWTKLNYAKLLQYSIPWSKQCWRLTHGYTRHCAMKIGLFASYYANATIAIVHLCVKPMHNYGVYMSLIDQITCKTQWYIITSWTETQLSIEYCKMLALGFVDYHCKTNPCKAQGQRLKIAGLYLQAPCFSHGQFYS